MATRFELVTEQDRVHYQLRGPDGGLLLTGVGGSNGRIGAQNSILHLRRAVQDPTHLVPHRDPDGKHFVVVKEANGEVIAKSPHVATAEHLAELLRKVPSAAAVAPIIDLTRRTPRSTAS